MINNNNTTAQTVARVTRLDHTGAPVEPMVTLDEASNGNYPHVAVSPDRVAVVFFFSSRRRHTRSVSAFLLNRSSDLSITTILKRRGCLTVPRLTLMSLIKMMLVMVSVAAISKTFGLLRFLLRLSFLAK